MNTGLLCELCVVSNNVILFLPSATPVRHAR
jgi:hypothetical protein